ncbi:SIR2 family protein [Pantoea agglomerans]|uniref:SIR2 family NAD-dependent protein deacylase n=1 Tax=Enterobacter agglomerans TaxID=549 RepID=UPI003C7EC705
MSVLCLSEALFLASRFVKSDACIACMHLHAKPCIALHRSGHTGRGSDGIMHLHEKRCIKRAGVAGIALRAKLRNSKKDYILNIDSTINNRKKFMKSHKEKIIPLLKYISERLWEGRAAVLVGAGFSKNAKPAKSNARPFPMWNELGDLFYKKVYCKDNEYKYSNVLKLADEVQAAFGRSTLDKIIKDAIPDNDYEPSDLHKSLLTLPWSDVFTTNYDTLLERTCVHIETRKYDVILNKDDLINAERPRIIKLHGSLPSERPFILTEEDYRKYPNDFSPFVNTVQQSLIENTLCLIGFSGDDPNFLSWIGWIRDNLGGNNSPKIYLIGLFSFNEAQRKLLERRNIVIVDLTYLIESDESHYKAYELFIEYLNGDKGGEYSLSWPNVNLMEYIQYDDDDDVKKQKILLFINENRRLRECYPGWCIVPEEVRSNFRVYLDPWHSAFKEIDILEGDAKLYFIYEILWGLKILLMPIFEDYVSDIEVLINVYNEKISSKSAEINHYQRREYTDIVDFLSVSLLKYYRQESEVEKWLDLARNIDKENRLKAENYADFEYENALFSYSRFDINETTKKLNAWERNELLPFHEAKRAGLLAELGMVDEAINILEKSLSVIRKNSLHTHKNDDYLNASHEAYVMLMLRFLKSSSWGNNLDEVDHAKDYTSRWATLSQYKCDPWAEIKYFNQSLENIQDDNSFSENYDFDIGIRTVTNTFGATGFSKQNIYALNLLIFYEELGMPYRIKRSFLNSETLKNAASIIYKYSPDWAIFCLIRLANEKAFSKVFSRYGINQMNRAEIERSINLYLNLFNTSYDYLQNNKIANVSDFHSAIMRVVPELLSRMITKTSFSKKKEVLDSLLIVYVREKGLNGSYYMNLLSRTIKSLSPQQKIELLTFFCKFPLKHENGKLMRHNLLNPFNFLVEDIDDLKPYVKNIKKKCYVAEDIKLIETGQTIEREFASIKLMVLYSLDCIKQSDVKKLTQALWKKRDRFGFPEDVSYYKFFFINNLHEGVADVHKLMNDYLITCNFPTQYKNGSKNIKLRRYNEPYMFELNGALRSYKINSEVWASIIISIEEWVKNDSKYLSSKDSETVNEFERRFSHVINILIQFSLTQRELLDERMKDKLESILLKMKGVGLYVNHALVSLSSANGNNASSNVSILNDDFLSDDIKVIVQALRGVDILLKSKGKYVLDFRKLSEKLKWNQEPGLSVCLNFIEEYIYNGGKLLDYFEKDLLSGLERVSKNNLIDDNNDFLDLLEVKLAASKLAFQLYDKLYKRINVPVAILKWKEIALSPDEFDEVQNTWIE